MLTPPLLDVIDIELGLELFDFNKIPPLTELIEIELGKELSDLISKVPTDSITILPF